MQINPVAPSNITEPKGAAAVAPPPPAKAPPAKAPPLDTNKKPVSEHTNGNGSANGAAAVAAAKGTAGTKTEITDVKPTGEANADGDPTFTLKVNGKEYKATQSEIIALAQKAKGAEAAMRRAADVEKLAENLLTNFDNDTYGLLVKRHGPEKAKEIAIGMVKNLIAQEQKTPEQIELDELRAGKKAADDAAALTKKQQEEQQRKVKQAELYKTMLMDIDKELNETHLPKDKLTLTRVLNYLAAGKKANGTVWTVRDAVKAVEIEDMSHATHYARRYVEGKLPSEKFREIIGEDAFKKLNKEQINLLKNADKKAINGSSGQEVPASSAAETPARKPRSLSKTKGSEGMSEREWRRQHGSLGGI